MEDLETETNSAQEQIKEDQREQNVDVDCNKVELPEKFPDVPLNETAAIAEEPVKNTEQTRKTDSPYMPAELNEEDEKEEINSGLPHVNCVEKIIICLDLNCEMDKDTFRSRSGDKFTQIQVIQKALRLFINSKSKMNPEHEFALVVLDNTAEWVSEFTNNPREIITLLDDLSCSTNPESETFDMSLLFDTVEGKVKLPVVDDPTLPPPYVIRIVFLYGRSNCMIESSNFDSQKILESSPYVFFDALYIHEPLSEENNCEEIFNRLCKLDHLGFSYIFEVTKNPTKLYVYMAQLLAHPLQRPAQQSAAYKLRPLTPVQLEPEVPNLPTT